MKRLLNCIAAVLLFGTSAHAQSYGLVFSSHEVVQEKRTALDLSPDDSLCLANDFELSFDLNFLPHHEIYFGYVFRIIAVGNGGSDQNIDLIYNQALRAFKVIVGENFSGISFTVDSSRLYRDWNRFTLHASPDKRLIQFSVNGHVVGSSPIPVIGSCFKFLWGANDYRKFRTRDIPPMQVKDIRLTSGAQQYYWPLDETTGETAMDKTGHHAARIKNPIWLKPKYQQWELVGSFAVNGYAGAAYDPKQDKLYITGADTLTAYTFTKDGYALDYIPTRHMEFLIGHQNIYDTFTGRLLDICIDRKTVSTFSFTTRAWDPNFSFGPLTEYWHANKFLSPADSSLYIFGGYGQLRYKNRLQRYHFPTHHWDTVKTTGDYLPPRYLAALGASDKYAYIAGGYGSLSGDQMLDPRNYYDLFRYDIKKRSFRKLLSLKTLSYPYTFANSMVVTNDNWYGLLFANDTYNSQLQLVEGRLTDSTYRLVGNAIPYTFHDIQSFADLFYSPSSNKLIAVTLFYSKYTADNQKDKNTLVHIYTLNYPPEPASLAITTATRRVRDNGTQLLILIGAVIVVGLTLFLVLFATARIGRRRRKTAAATNTMATNTAANTPAANTPPGLGTSAAAGTTIAATAQIPATSARETPSVGEAPPQPIAGWPSTASQPEPELSAGFTDPAATPNASLHTSAIYLFGPFQAFDRDGHDCTRAFTPLLKELFLIITTYTIRNGRGISSEGLNEILWHDKAEKDAKNNRSVNLAKLKPILEKIGNCSITKAAGYWQLQAQDDTFLDYKRFAGLLGETTTPDARQIHALIDIIKRGPFLLQTEYNWLDDIKSEVSNAVIDRCLSYLRHHGSTENPEFIIEITNCIFYFDQLNEDALTFKCKSLIHLKRHNLASNTYLKFAKDYKDIYNADFSRSFQEIIA
ncbi:hypothetical protein [Puia dinghuensis]|uniref:Galactose oxidase n=1 Tax=Puia dinghuensis TaxID=1792502 RepID=A0A8J2UCG4_9BACT|nr:hypothetical protein [Puia dinghuensis]GGA97223.1 hypothetical protein GCM10011511_20700 [Puia dinghuensis]